MYFCIHVGDEIVLIHSTNGKANSNFFIPNLLYDSISMKLLMYNGSLRKITDDIFKIIFSVEDSGKAFIEEIIQPTEVMQTLTM